MFKAAPALHRKIKQCTETLPGKGLMASPHQSHLPSTRLHPTPSTSREFQRMFSVKEVCPDGPGTEVLRMLLALDILICFCIHLIAIHLSLLHQLLRTQSQRFLTVVHTRQQMKKVFNKFVENWGERNVDNPRKMLAVTRFGRLTIGIHCFRRSNSLSIAHNPRLESRNSILVGRDGLLLIREGRVDTHTPSSFQNGSWEESRGCEWDTSKRPTRNCSWFSIFRSTCEESRDKDTCEFWLTQEPRSTLSARS